MGEGGEAPPSKSKDKIRTFYPEMNKTFESIYLHLESLYNDIKSNPTFQHILYSTMHFNV